MVMPGETALTPGERTARRLLIQDTRGAAAVGKSLDQYRRWREAQADDWCDWLRLKMQELHCDEPQELLPQLAIAIEERCLAECRKVAKETAAETMRLMLRKAIT
jgi:hypothetical protein